MAETPARAPLLRTRAQGPGWRIGDVRCALGPGDRPFEERHSHVSIAAVLGGTFEYRSPQGRALLYPGAFMLGNAGTCYECGHEHGVGDHCLAFQFETPYFDEIAHGITGARDFRFRPGMLPALRSLAAPLLCAQAQLAAPALAAEEAAVALAEAVIGSTHGAASTPAAPPARIQRRLAAVMRYIEEHSREALDLDRLAALAFMSKYHFLRTFRSAAGLTPYQYVVGQRLRQAALALRRTDAPVADVAFDEGFGDLAGFHAQFRQAFGISPGAFRRQG